MWNSEILAIKTPGQLIEKIINCKTGLSTNIATDTEVCCMCNEKFPVTSMKKADEVLSNSFGGFTQVFSGSFDTGILCICKYCELTLVDNYYCHIFVSGSPLIVFKKGKEKGKGKFKTEKISIVDSHAIIAYWHDHHNKLFRTINKSNRHKLTEFFFDPPKGAFMIALNKPFFGGQRSHYLCNGVINYNFGECKSYIATYLDKRFTVDLDVAKRYVELVKKYKQKVKVPADLEFYRKNKDIKNIKNKKTKALIEMINEVGEEFFVENTYLMKVLNVLVEV